MSEPDPPTDSLDAGLKHSPQTCPEQRQALAACQAELVQLRATIIQQEQHYQVQVERSHALNRVIQTVRQSLDLQTVFATATHEVAELLKVDAAVIVEYLTETQVWRHIRAHQRRLNLPDPTGLEIPDDHNPLSARLRNLEVICINNTADLSDPINQELARSFPGAWLLVPLVVNQQLWGCLTLWQTNTHTDWSEAAVDLAIAVADQVAIAIQQAHLYQQAQAELSDRRQAEAEREQAQIALQQLNQELEQRVYERTAQLETVNLQLLDEVVERRHIETALRASEARLQRLTNNLPDGIFQLIMQPDGSQNFTYLSPRMGSIYEVSLAAALEDARVLWQTVHPEDVPLVQQAIALSSQTLKPSILRHRILTSSGLKWVEVRSQPEQLPNGTTIWDGVSVDMTDYEQTESQLRNSLREKEVLLREIHHRVKNNLQMISSLLRLQVSTIQDPEILEPFQDSQNRVRAMALVHEKLYRSPDLACLDFAEYTRSLISYLLRSYVTQQSGIQLQVEIPSIELATDEAIACGLILNELISNAIKHAFPEGEGREGERREGERREGERREGERREGEGREGEGREGDRRIRERREGDRRIQVQFVQQPDHQCVLSVTDNGIGLPVEFKIEQTDSLGLQLVSSLTQQLRGKLEVHHQPGTAFVLTFPRTILQNEWAP